MNYYLLPKQRAILKRSLSGTTAGNYDEALDGDISSFRAGVTREMDRQKAEEDYTYPTTDGPYPNLFKLLPTGLSNCTLTATQWVDPKTPLMRAQTIIDDGNKYGYVEIPESHLLPGDLVIATNPFNNAHHTMLVHGFTNAPQEHTFLNKNYVLPKGHPLVRYSTGSTHPSSYRRSVGLMEYIDNSHGKTDVKYYRHYDPGTNRVLLPEVVVTPKGNYFPKGQKIIKITR